MKHFYLVLSSTILAAISLASTTVAADDSHHKPLSIQAYLAGPDVFEPNPIAIGERKKAICAKHGLTCHFPMDNKIEDFDLSAKTGLKIGRLNEKLMDKSAIILANMTPWHGPGMDTGTAFEMGYMRAQGKIVIGYTEDLRPFSQRVREHFESQDQKVKEHPDGSLTDPEGKSIERFGNFTDNLMMINAVKSSGAHIVGSFEEAVELAVRLTKEH